MKIIISFCLLAFIIGCSSNNPNKNTEVKEFEFVAHQNAQSDQTHRKIAFGSCSKENLPQEYWQVIAKENPDLWIWLGDVIYGDSGEKEVMLQKYKDLYHKLHYQTFIKKVPVTGIWDDHDFGVNNGGKDFEYKKQNAELFLNFLNDQSEARNREGIYRSFLLGKEQGKQILLLLLDTRYFKGKVHSKEGILGKEQWKWLENKLQNNKAPLVIVASGIQVISEDHPYETWGQYPEERKKLLEALSSSNAYAVILSGDRHISEFSAINKNAKEILDFTSSGLTHAYSDLKSEKNSHRIGGFYADKSFGTMEIDWENKVLQLNIISTSGEQVQSISRSF